MASDRVSNKDEIILNAIFNPLLPVTTDQPQSDEVIQNSVEEDTDAVKEAKKLEIDGVNAAEAGNFDESLDFFNRSISVAPFSASGYNNRAQLMRIRGDPNGALEDLNKAIELSDGRGKVAAQAFTQRGLLNKLNGNENDALEDFKKAACLGNSFAKQQVVQMNPYAALCNQMLADVIGKIRRGEPDS